MFHQSNRLICHIYSHVGKKDVCDDTSSVIIEIFRQSSQLTYVLVLLSKHKGNTHVGYTYQLHTKDRRRKEKNTHMSFSIRRAFIFSIKNLSVKTRVIFFCYFFRKGKEENGAYKLEMGTFRNMDVHDTEDWFVCVGGALHRNDLSPSDVLNFVSVCTSLGTLLCLSLYTKVYAKGEVY